MTKTLAVLFAITLGVTVLRAEEGADRPPKLPVPLKPAPGDDDLRKLKIEHANALHDALSRFVERIEGGVFRRTDELPPFLDTQRRLLDARLALEPTPAGKQQVVEGYLAFAQWFYKTTIWKSDVDSPTVLPLAKAYKLEVEIRLAEFQTAAK